MVTFLGGVMALSILMVPVLIAEQLFSSCQRWLWRFTISGLLMLTIAVALTMAIYVQWPEAAVLTVVLGLTLVALVMEGIENQNKRAAERSNDERA